MTTDNNFFFLSIDIGTSGCRACLLTSLGDSLSDGQYSYSYYHDSSTGFAEQDPDEIYKAFINAVKGTMLNRKEAVKFIVFGSALHSLVLVDAQGTPLTPLSIWADTRALNQCVKHEKIFREENWRRKSGCTLSPVYPLYRLLWYKKHCPKLYETFFKALSVKSYILHRLTGYFIEDHSLASGSGLFNLHTREWDPCILESIGLKKERLPELVSVEHSLPARSFDLSIQKIINNESAMLIVGSSDGPLAHLGTAGSAPDSISLTIGTSGAVRVLTKDPILSIEDESIWCYALDSKSFVSGLATNNGGNVVDWFVREFYPAETKWEQIEGFLHKTTFKPDLLFSPFLFGERRNIGSSTAAFIGLKPDCCTNDLLRSVIEGVVFNMFYLLNRLRSVRNSGKIFSSGSLLKLQFVQDLIELLAETSVVHCAEENASLKGSTVLALGKDIKNSGLKTVFLNNFGTSLLSDQDYKNKYLEWEKVLLHSNKTSVTD